VGGALVIERVRDPIRYSRNWTPYSSIRGHHGDLTPPFLGWTEKTVEQPMKNFLMR